MGINKQYLNRL